MSKGNHFSDPWEETFIKDVSPTNESGYVSGRTWALTYAYMRMVENGSDKEDPIQQHAA